MSPHATARFAVLLMATLWVPPASADTEHSGRVSVAAQEDSNPAREFTPDGGSPQWAAALSAAGTLEGGVTKERFSADAVLDVAGRKFLQGTAPRPDTFVIQGTVGARYWLSERVFLGLHGVGRERMGDRPYADALGLLDVGARLSPTTTAVLQGGAQRFLYSDDYSFSYSTTVWQPSLEQALSRAHALAATFAYEPRRYNAGALDAQFNPTGQQRRDNVWTGGVRYTFRGPVRATLAYAFTKQASNSYGQTNLRHRVTGTLAARLPWRLNFLAQGTLLFAHYPQSVPLDQEVVLNEDEDNTSSVAARIVRPLTEWLDVELRYALYVATLVQNNFNYQRQLGGVALTARF